MTRMLLAIYRIRGPFYGIATLILVAVAVTSRFPMWDGSRPARAAVAFVALGVLVACVLLVFVGARLVPERDTSVVDSPVGGRWMGMNSPVAKVPSHGIRLYGQAYAIDLVHEPTDAKASDIRGRPGDEACAGLPGVR